MSRRANTKNYKTLFGKYDQLTCGETLKQMTIYSFLEEQTTDIWIKEISVLIMIGASPTRSFEDPAKTATG